MGWAFNVKRHELLKRFHSCNKPKCKQTVFIARVTKYWYSKTKAIKPWDMRSGTHRIKTEIKQEWRICTRCGLFKLWDQFAKSKDFRQFYTSDCKECRNRIHQERRIQERYSKDREYKLRRRKLQIGDLIAFMEPVVIEEIPREDAWKVIAYEHNKWYTIRSIRTREVKQLDTGDNPQSDNCKKFYKIIW